MVIYNLIKKWAKQEVNKMPFSGRKTEEKQNGVRIMRSVHEKETVFSVKGKGNRLDKDIKKENFKKDPMNLIETNH